MVLPDIIAVAFPMALAVVMFGLGLTLTMQDFARVVQVPKAVVIALVCQVVLLPAIGLGLVVLFRMDPLLAVGIMILLASPGGAVANLFSHLAEGDVALNITLTAINSLLAVLTLPMIVGLSLAGFLGDAHNIGLQTWKLLQVLAFVVIPTVIGMWVRRRSPTISRQLDRPFRVGSAIVIAAGLALTIVQDLATFLDNLLVVGGVSLLLSTFSVLIGYWVPYLCGVDRRQAIASSMEVGIHNGALALTIAITVLGNPTIAIAPAVYNVVAFIPVLVALYVFSSGRRGSRATPEPGLRSGLSSGS